MDILMTGGTGLIGRAFINRYPDYRYTVLTRSAKTNAGMFPASVQTIDSLSALTDLDKFDAVINLAGEPILDKRWTDRQKDVICQSRWQITQQLVELFTHSTHPPLVFLSGSAIGVYGNRGDAILSESATVQENDFPTTVCLNWETIARQAQAHTQVVLLRTGIVLDPRGGALNKMLLPFKLGLGGRIGTGRQYMSWIHYQDQVDAMNFLLHERGVAGAVNLVAPGAVTNQEFTRCLARSLHRPALLPVPALALKQLLGESSCLLLDSQRVQPQQLEANGFQFAFGELPGALVDLLN